MNYLAIRERNGGSPDATSVSGKENKVSSNSSTREANIKTCEDIVDF